MKRIAIYLLVLVLALAMLPAAAMAYMNNIEITLMSGSGSFETPGAGGLDADISMAQWGLGYTRYFKDIETNETPFGTREFLQHPSRFGISLDGIATTVEDNNSADELTSAEVSVMIGGMYYLEHGVYDTGLGLTLVSTGAGTESSGITWGNRDTETSGSAIILSLDQYVADNVSIGLEIESGSYTWEDNLSTAEEDHDKSSTKLSVQSFISDKFWLEAELGGGKVDYEFSDDEDMDLFNLLAGIYLNQKTALFLGLETENTKDDGGGEQKVTVVHFGGDFYFNERMHLMASLASMKNEMSSNGVDTGEMKLGMLRLDFGAFF